jgi:hypothetical protein
LVFGTEDVAVSEVLLAVWMVVMAFSSEVCLSRDAIAFGLGRAR